MGGLLPCAVYMGGVTTFPFDDLHGFKDYVVFVRMCAPDNFPQREGRPSNEQWTLELALEGLQQGLTLAVREKGNRPQFERARQLFENASSAYRMGDKLTGFKALDEAHKLIRQVRSQ